MKGDSPWRFRVAATFAAISAVLAVVTLIWKDWIEIVFGFEPDQGSGEIELLITGAFFVAAIVLTVVAVFEHRKRTLLLGTPSK